MSKLLQRLSDPVRSGVYRSRDERAILDATRAAPLDVAVVEASGDLFDSLSQALELPACE